MAAALLVRLCPAPDASEKPLLKLQSYFQSGKRSGGGECEVQTGPEPGTYWVRFQQERDKRSVVSRTDHTLEIGARHLKIIIEQGEGDPSEGRVTEQPSPSGPVRSSCPPPQQEQQAARGHGGTAREVITKKIFLTVSATLNTSMFTEQQREKITIVCPNLKREGNPNIDGSEKLTGDFTDIEKAYRYFKDILAGNDPKHDFSHSESENYLKDENVLNTEEMNELTVLSALYEYFIHTCKQQIKVLRERFGVCIRSKDNDNGTTSVCLTSDKSPSSIQEANDFFIRTFQKSVEDLKQEKIPITNSDTLNETIMKLNARFSNLLAKGEGNQLLLRGPASVILLAKTFLAEEAKNSQAEKNMKISSELYKYRNGIEVDASLFKLLETKISKEIEGIKDKFDTVTEMRVSSYSQKMLIVFRPRNKTTDMSSHATESFINAFQNAFAMLREKHISLKLSEGQNRKLDTLFNGKRLEDLHVKLTKKEDKIILSGLPDNLYVAENLIVNLLNTEDSPQTKNRPPVSSDLSYQATGASGKKHNGRQKNNVSSEGQAKAKTENDKDMCPICMERIIDKEILKKCNHVFCKDCITQAMSYKQTCPICNTFYGPMKGDQPEGIMSTRTLLSSLPGYPRCGTIEIKYYMHGGIQTRNHPNPGKPYSATSRTAYLPDNKEGQEILQLLKRAFNQKLIFTVGQSHTTGAKDVITWNDIHHKTSMTGGPTKMIVECFMEPDLNHLQTSLDSWNKDELVIHIILTR
ncbi:E3 ubiquitin-protein ligase DTX3L isoform X1 [Falco rusticolus]|uniref:E3 ubiquitin-protein ligase DTX3L isoform X1 n=1 Tax=Falco rusticolus TaxID=120794 RepID=UPI0018869710|nr:E3 ubiquitin-protein ligase DTX3L isoform X1 [Falco rusticolus]